MALEFEFRATFIDVKESPSVYIMPRSFSQPLPARLSDIASDAQDEVRQLRDYVTTLSQRSEQLSVLLRRKDRPSATCNDEKLSSALETCSTASTNETALRSSSGESSAMLDIRCNMSEPSTAALEDVMPIQGSVGHPEVCRRPCIFFAAGSCENGSSCGYCHMPHTERPPHLDKRRREVIQKLSEAELLDVVLKHLRARAAEKGFLSEAADVLQVVEQWSPQSSATPQNVSHKLLDKLDIVLHKMSFSSLLGLLLHSPDAKSNQSQYYCDEVTEALAKMRSRMAANATS